MFIACCAFSSHCEEASALGETLGVVGDWTVSREEEGGLGSWL